MCLPAEVLLTEVLLVGFLPLGVLLAAEGEMVLVASGLLERKEKILLGLVILGRRRCCCSLALCLCFGAHGTFSLRLTGLGGIGTFASSLCRCAGMLIQKEKFVSTSVTDVK
jgi:hypothetical protein